MRVRLALLREAIQLAQSRLAQFKTLCPTSHAGLTEVDEIEMGLEWILRRVDRLEAGLDSGAIQP